MRAAPGHHSAAMGFPRPRSPGYGMHYVVANKLHMGPLSTLHLFSSRVTSNLPSRSAHMIYVQKLQLCTQPVPSVARTTAHALQRVHLTSPEYKRKASPPRDSITCDPYTHAPVHCALTRAQTSTNVNARTLANKGVCEEDKS